MCTPPAIRGQGMHTSVRQYDCGTFVIFSLPTISQLVSLCVAAQPADCKMCRLLHDISKLTSQSQLTFPVHAAGFYKHDFSP